MERSWRPWTESCRRGTSRSAHRSNGVREANRPDSSGLRRLTHGLRASRLVGSQLRFPMPELLAAGWLALLGVAPLWLTFRTYQVYRKQITLTKELDAARIQGRQWRDETRALLRGLGEAIDRQFVTWKLTDAEREIGLLILKGLSLKEIASVRVTSERTIRAQAQSIYAKAGLSGRAALSAFFLEDLLAPIERAS